MKPEEIAKRIQALDTNLKQSFSSWLTPPSLNFSSFNLLFSNFLSCSLSHFLGF
jgi:hypothetical protein